MEKDRKICNRMEMNKFVTYNGIQEELVKYNYYNLAKDFSRQIDSLVN